MASYWVILVIVLVHVVLYVTDTVLKSCLHLPYLNLLEASGVTVRPLQLKWSTRALNRPFQRWGAGGGRLARLWFSAGVWVACALLVPSVLLLLHTVHSLLRPAAAEGAAATAAPPAFVLEPVLPGVNLPAEDVPYYVITLLVCSVYHECGHAVAAVREQVRVFGSGLLLVLVLPAAFVDVCSEALSALPPFRRLRVLCAGVWHNVVLCAAAAALLAALPLLTAPLYRVGQGAVVYSVHQVSIAQDGGVYSVYQVSIAQDGGVYSVYQVSIAQGGGVYSVYQVSIAQGGGVYSVYQVSIAQDGGVYSVYQDSPLHGATGLSAGDLVTAVNECPVRSRRDWLSCLARAASEPQTGYCVSTDLSATYDETIQHPYPRDDTGLVECCDASNSSSHLCFEFVGDDGTPDWTAPPFSCLPARAVLDSGPARCQTTASCGEPARCFRPALEPAVRLLSLRRRAGPAVLFLGAPGTVFADAAVSDHEPRWWPLPAAAPRRIQTLAHYVLSFSAALAVLNVVPCFALDGQWIWAALLEAALGGRVSRRRRATIERAGVLAGSALLAANVVLGLRSVFRAS
ncbi:Membrane-bound transcription factor site-2 protease [Amphibalanus amphitrite]|uniref:Membrane-bound transcription factor site-2 protease n=1 Tax=Amphibalanus amphitrite TaxID=1232801 RepID=A0A6A4XBG0_AMPAM|nr:Membrane-bound transcription factor site-2 protease [Amphibalanus amphitrite]